MESQKGEKSLFVPGLLSPGCCWSRSGSAFSCWVLLLKDQVGSPHEKNRFSLQRGYVGLLSVNFACPDTHPASAPCIPWDFSEMLLKTQHKLGNSQSPLTSAWVLYSLCSQTVPERGWAGVGPGSGLFLCLELWFELDQGPELPPVLVCVGWGTWTWSPHAHSRVGVLHPITGIPLGSWHMLPHYPSD